MLCKRRCPPWCSEPPPRPSPFPVSCFFLPRACSLPAAGQACCWGRWSCREHPGPQTHTPARSTSSTEGLPGRLGSWSPCGPDPSALRGYVWLQAGREAELWPSLSPRAVAPESLVALRGPGLTPGCRMTRVSSAPPTCSAVCIASRSAVHGQASPAAVLCFFTEGCRSLEPGCQGALYTLAPLPNLRRVTAFVCTLPSAVTSKTQ